MSELRFEEPAEFAEFEADLGPEEVTDDEIDQLEALAAADDAAQILGTAGAPGSAGGADV
ncbi:hypothetical protein OG394_24135 [Kribbella sp. NBC_01245]|uniref:hypothetical protein n=1 Tax=Kribbella sp. NBC_01245 TaxID=2903578 RepID=UPI002E29BF65|nr:hypothetical protein [Kribbella sp. NBC_01245]